MSQKPLISEDLIRRQPPEPQAIIRTLLAKIAELEARLNKTPQNSSLPPSSQHPHVKPAPPRTASGKKPGGQPGHEKFEGALVPPRHQIAALPEIKPLITESQLPRLTCVGCGISTTAELPPGVPHGQSGPRLVAFVALLMAYFRQSK